METKRKGQKENGAKVAHAIANPKNNKNLIKKKQSRLQTENKIVSGLLSSYFFFKANRRREVKFCRYLQFISITSGRYCLAPVTLRFGDGQVCSSDKARGHSRRRDVTASSDGSEVCITQHLVRPAEDGERPIPPVSGLQ